MRHTNTAPLFFLNPSLTRVISGLKGFTCVFSRPLLIMTTGVFSFEGQEDGTEIHIMEGWFPPAATVSQTPTSPRLLGNMSCFCWEADGRLTPAVHGATRRPWRQKVELSPLKTIKWAITAFFKLPGGADIGHMGVFTYLHCSLCLRPKAGWKITSFEKLNLQISQKPWSNFFPPIFLCLRADILSANMCLSLFTKPCK